MPAGVAGPAGYAQARSQPAGSGAQRAGPGDIQDRRGRTSTASASWASARWCRAWWSRRTHCTTCPPRRRTTGRSGRRTRLSLSSGTSALRSSSVEALPAALSVQDTSHACSLDLNGVISCQGVDDSAQVTGLPASGVFTAISVGERPLLRNRHLGGRVHCWGSDEHGQVSGLTQHRASS